MELPSGHNVVLSSGEYEAVVVGAGAGIRSLRRDGLDVVAGYPQDQMCSSGRGQILTPWPNRIEDGRYEFGGSSYQLSLTEPAKLNASHGLTRWVTWTLAEQTRSSARWTYALPPQPGYPFRLDLTVGYVLGADGLQVEVTAANVGTSVAPYGVGAHPYLTVGRRIDECELTLPATTRSEMSERGLPGATASVLGGEFDFTSPRMVGSAVFDHPFGGLRYTDGAARAVLRDPASGREASLTFDDSSRWLQVFSGETLSTGVRESLAIEPMSCPPNAFRSGQDLVALEPGDRHTLTFTLA